MTSKKKMEDNINFKAVLLSLSNKKNLKKPQNQMGLTP
jgi:hypothetical protein